MTYLNRQQFLVYDYVAQYLERQGQSPLQREIADALDVKQQTISAILHRLRQWGYITFPTNTSRQIQLTDREPEIDLLAYDAQHSNPEQTLSLNPRRVEIYRYIAQYLQTHHYPPVLREIAKHLNVGTTTVKYHIDVLRDLGYLSYLPGKARSIRLLDDSLLASNSNSN